MKSIVYFGKLYDAGIATRAEVRKVFTDNVRPLDQEARAAFLVSLVPAVFTVAEAREFLGLEPLPEPPPTPDQPADDKPRKAKKAPVAA